MSRAKLSFAHLPTPLWRHDALDALVGAQVWIKRDDTTSGPEAGNKIRKLEYHLAAARQQEADTVITCGGFQSNHARATALLAAGLGMRSVLLLRSQPLDVRPVQGNAMLAALAGAEIRTVTPEGYAQRDARMQAIAASLQERGESCYVIPEGGSDGLGALGYVDAMAEVRQQLDDGQAGGPGPFDVVVHACGSGGTAAGAALGAAQSHVAPRVWAMAVCDDAAHFEGVVASLIRDARALEPELGEPAELKVWDEWKGPAYGVADRRQLAFIVEVARQTGLILDPVYSGKALYALSQVEPKPHRVLFIHTGGLPGLLAQADAFDRWLPPATPA